jgi:hypothetical protein
VRQASGSAEVELGDLTDTGSCSFSWQNAAGVRRSTDNPEVERRDGATRVAKGLVGIAVDGVVERWPCRRSFSLGFSFYSWNRR